MIISVSRRTDIPAYYADWFFGRLKEGYALVRNPRNPAQITRVPIDPESVNGFVFWSKNPSPMLVRLNLLNQYTYYFQFTVTPYGTDLEPNVPDKKNIIIPAFRRLADSIGAKRVIWRYDPILLNSRYNFAYHLRAFDAIAKALCGATEKCIFSFVDSYKNTFHNKAALDLSNISCEQQHMFAKELSLIAKGYGIALETCAEQIDLSAFCIDHAHCIDASLIQSLAGNKLPLKKAHGQRSLCGCAQSVDIGAYNSCENGCLYCYANYSKALVRKNLADYDLSSPLLCERLTQ